MVGLCKAHFNSPSDSPSSSSSTPPIFCCCFLFSPPPAVVLVIEAKNNFVPRVEGRGLREDLGKQKVTCLEKYSFGDFDCFKLTACYVIG